MGRRKDREDGSDDDDAGQSQGDASIHKRARTQPVVQEEFKRGTVKKIRVHNFMTYAGTVTITPGPRLNLVLGPNGTGKSSLVCALCVGLAGSTKLLGRADNLSCFVRNNCDRCWTEITLSGGPGQPDIVIHRKITVEHYMEEGQRKRRYNSEYKINGAGARQEAVKEKVKELNIQFDNLCQFLPQDKVVEFARMNPQELLVATEKALGDSTLHETHEQLTALRLEMKGKEGDLQRAQGRLDRLTADQEQQRRDYERFKQRETLKEQAKLRRMKVEYLKAKAAKDQERVAKRAAEEAAQQLQQLEAEVQDEQGPIKECEKLKTAAGRARDQVKTLVTEKGRDVVKCSDELEEARTDVDTNLEEQRSLQAASDARRAAIAEFAREIRDLQAQLAALPTELPQELQARVKQFQETMRVAHEKQGQLNEEQTEVQREMRAQDHTYNMLSRRHDELSNVRNQKLNAFINSNPRFSRLREVVEFINANRSQFRGPVYGPLVLDINVQPANPAIPGSQKWASYVEKHCGHLLSHFVTSSRDDERRLSQFLKEKNIHVVVAAVTHDFSAPVPHPLGEASQYSSYGVTHTLDQLIEAPALIKHMLSDLAKINRVYVGTESLFNNIDGLFRNTRVQSVYTGDQRVSNSISRYNKDAASTQFDVVPPARMLSTESLAEAEREQQQLAAQLRQCDEDRQRSRRRQQELEAQAQAQREAQDHAARGLQEIDNRHKQLLQRRHKAQFDLGTKQKRLANKENEPDPLDKAPALDKQRQMMLKALVKKGANLVAVTKAYWQAMRRYTAAEMKFKYMEAKLSELQDQVKRAQTQLKDARALATQTEAAWKVAKAKFTQAKESFAAFPPMTDDIKGQMKNLTDDIQQLEQEAVQQEAQAHAITCNNDRVMLEFEQRQREIDHMTEQVQAQTDELTAQQGQLDQLQAEWLPPLQQLVAEISGWFEENFKQMGCAGEVKLVEHQDYDKFAIQIWVKFRNSEPMQVLTANRQSGGERSVATILYLIALQGVTETPFRVVDEINQGMDPNNERKVFIQLVESSCQPDTPQCFLLTPKLLPDLPFAPEITVLNIMNGAGIDKAVIADFDARVVRAGPAGHLHALLGARWQGYLQAAGAAG